MKLVINNSQVNHKHAISDCLEGASKVLFACAFIKTETIKEIGNILTDVLNQGGHVEGYCGTDFFITQPEALRYLLTIQHKHSQCQFYAFDQNIATFHPKIYVGFNGKVVSCLVGSCNLTHGGVQDNIEASLAVTVERSTSFAKQIIDYFEDIRLNERCKPLEALLIDAYEVKYDIAKKSEKDFKRRLKEIESMTTFDWTRTDALLQEWRSNADAQADLRRRIANRNRARKEVDIICGINHRQKLLKVEALRFEKAFRNLVTSKGGLHLWHSGAIHRRGLQALKNPNGTIKMFCEIRNCANMDPGQAFDIAINAAQGISGVGVNIVTEAMATINHTSFAIINGNTIGALRFLGLPVPYSTNKKTFKRTSYVKVLATLSEIRQRISVKNFSEVDSFLNFLYWRYARQS